MSELKIGEFTIETDRYYDALLECGVTSSDELKALDKNKDKKLTEDELNSLDVPEEEIAQKEIIDSNQDIETRCKSLISTLEKTIDSLERQRDAIISEVGVSSSMDMLDNNVSELSEIISSISDARSDILDLLNGKISGDECHSRLEKYKNTVKNLGKTKKTNKTKSSKKTGKSNIKFNFSENMTESQAASLPMFVNIWNNNKSRYEAVSKKTGVPAELIAAIHWRESGCNFSTYLHNGDPLGQPTTHVPAGKLFYNWEDAAVDALKSQSYNVDSNDINSWYEYAERYNGLGYRNRGVASPYVWAGTTNYTGGKYVADGVYDSSAYDQQLGVALMLKAIVK